jgi:L-seryl-tRNA(Ser) seleniumtransferase
VLAIEADHPNHFLDLLRQGQPSVIARVEEDLVLLDPRTVLPRTDQDLILAIQAAWSEYEK